MNGHRDTPTYEILLSDKDKGLEVLYERYADRLYGYAIHSWKISEDEAWELVYQTLYKTVEKVDEYSFEDEKKFRNYLFVVFSNLLRRNYRDAKNMREKLDIVYYNESSFDDSRGERDLGVERQVQDKITKASMDAEREEPEESEEMQLLEKALEQMETWERILLLQRSQNMPYNEIANFIDKPANQLKVYHQRAMKKLQKIIGGLAEQLKEEVQ